MAHGSCGKSSSEAFDHWIHSDEVVTLEEEGRGRGMTIWKYFFADGTKLELLNVGLSTEEVRKLMELHGACTVDFEIIKSFNR